MKTNLLDYDSLFTSGELKYPHRMIIHTWPHDTVMSRDVVTDAEHRSSYMDSIHQLQIAVGEFRPIVTVKVTLDKFKTIIEVRPPKEMLEEMGALQ